jgi:hypothetical protein
LLLAGAAWAQQQPERNELFWCQQQRNFAFDTAAKYAAEASRLQVELDKLKSELEGLKQK